MQYDLTTLVLWFSELVEHNWSHYALVTLLAAT